MILQIFKKIDSCDAVNSEGAANSDVMLIRKVKEISSIKFGKAQETNIFISSSLGIFLSKAGFFFCKLSIGISALYYVCVFVCVCCQCGSYNY